MKYRQIAKLLGLGSLVLASSVMLSACTNMGSTPNNSRAVKTTSTAHYAYNFPATRAATGKNVFVFDPKQYAWAAYDKKGHLVRDGIASGGRDFCSDINSACRTPVGTYTVYREGDARCTSSIFPLGEGGAPMPNCMFFKGGYAVHGSYDVPNYNASHGCIRVTPSDAAWLNDNFINVGTTVVVKPY